MQNNATNSLRVEGLLFWDRLDVQCDLFQHLAFSIQHFPFSSSWPGVRPDWVLFEIRIARFSSGNPWSTAPQRNLRVLPPEWRATPYPISLQDPLPPSGDNLRFCPISKPQDAWAEGGGAGVGALKRLGTGERLRALPKWPTEVGPT